MSRTCKPLKYVCLFFFQKVLFVFWDGSYLLKWIKPISILVQKILEKAVDTNSTFSNICLIKCNYTWYFLYWKHIHKNHSLGWSIFWRKYAFSVGENPILLRCYKWDLPNICYVVFHIIMHNVFGECSRHLLLGQTRNWCSKRFLVLCVGNHAAVKKKLHIAKPKYTWQTVIAAAICQNVQPGSTTGFFRIAIIRLFRRVCQKFQQDQRLSKEPAARESNKNPCKFM